MAPYERSESPRVSVVGAHELQCWKIYRVSRSCRFIAFGELRLGVFMADRVATFTREYGEKSAEKFRENLAGIPHPVSPTKTSTYNFTNKI